jgi:hypothetical protein
LRSCCAQFLLGCRLITAEVVTRTCSEPSITILTIVIVV